jgi:hypothetical protein
MEIKLMTTKINMKQIEEELIELVLDNPTRKDIWFIEELNEEFDEDELLILYDRIAEIKDEYHLSEIVDFEH